MENWEIIDVVRTAEQDSDLLLAYAIDKPKKGTKKDVATIDVLGWIVGKKSPTVAVEIMNGDRLLQRIPIDVPRADVGERFSTVPEAKNSGFEATVELIGLENTPQPPFEKEGELVLEAIFKDEARLRIGVVRYKLELSVAELEDVPVAETEVQEQESVDLEKIKADLERSRAFLQKMEEQLTINN